MPKPYDVTGVPGPKSGCKILMARQIIELLKAKGQPLQDAIERINRFEGKPRMIQKVASENIRKNRTAQAIERLQIRDQQRKIDQAYERKYGHVLNKYGLPA